MPQLLAAAAAAAGSLLVAAPGLAASASGRAAAAAAAEAAGLLLQAGVTGGAPAYPEEWAELAAQLSALERCAARAEWLRRRLAADAPAAAEALLASAAAGEAEAEVELSPGHELALLRARLVRSEMPAECEYVLTARCGAGAPQRMHTRLEGGLVVVSTALRAPFL
jgi:hypothetical protein